MQTQNPAYTSALGKMIIGIGAIILGTVLSNSNVLNDSFFDGAVNAFAIGGWVILIIGIVGVFRSRSNISRINNLMREHLDHGRAVGFVLDQFRERRRPFRC
jgi:hypothetical protein